MSAPVMTAQFSGMSKEIMVVEVVTVWWPSDACWEDSSVGPVACEPAPCESVDCAEALSRSEELFLEPPISEHAVREEDRSTAATIAVARWKVVMVVS